MSMHLASPGLTTTSIKKRKNKITKAQQGDLERGWRDRNVRLKQMGLQKETFEQYLVWWVYGKGKKNKAEAKNGTKGPAPTSTKIANKGQCDIGNTPKYNIDRGGSNDNHKNDYSTEPSNGSQTRRKSWVTGPCASKPSPTYTGTKIIGICQMAKSNAVPVFSDEEAIEISKMRR